METLVVDEADLVLSFGYSDDIRAVTKCLPKICQGFLMSATLSAELEDLKRVVLHRCGAKAPSGRVWQRRCVEVASEGGGRGCMSPAVGARQVLCCVFVCFPDVS